MPATVYTLPADAQPSGESTVVRSVSISCNEVADQHSDTDQTTTLARDTVLEATFHESHNQPTAHAGQTHVEAHVAASAADARPEHEPSAGLPIVLRPVSGVDREEPASTPAVLPAVLADTLEHQARVEQRKHKQQRDTPGSGSASTLTITSGTDGQEVVDSRIPVDQTTPLSAVDDRHNPDWKNCWPTNELVMYAVLDPSTAQAPTVDGVRLIRTQAQITEIDPDTGDIGIVAKVPVQILPMARGYEPLYNEITRARRLKQRVRPFLVELRGICKRLTDQDTRFATTRRTTLFGMQISTVKRIDKDQMQWGRWRGRGTVSAVRPFELDGVDYYRVTLEVASTKKKVFLRGESAQVDPVDVLIRKDHQHVQRFRRVGQRLLVEAEITAQTSIMRDTHPALEGLDDETRQRLAMIRQGIVLANMGEFPDEQAEHDFANWHRSGVGNPGRPGRGRRPDGTGTGRNGNTAPRPAKQENRQLHRKYPPTRIRAEQTLVEQADVVA